MTPVTACDVIATWVSVIAAEPLDFRAQPIHVSGMLLLGNGHAITNPVNSGKFLGSQNVTVLVKIAAALQYIALRQSPDAA